MELPYISSNFHNKNASQFVCSSNVLPKWSYEENKLFENALAHNKLEFPDIFYSIASIIPSKTTQEIQEHYEALVQDIELIESDRVPLPNYKDDCTSVVGRRESTHQQKKRSIRWTKEEHERFLVGLKKYGRGDWKSISRDCVMSKNPTQVASHAQKYYLRLHKSNTNKATHVI